MKMRALDRVSHALDYRLPHGLIWPKPPQANKLFQKKLGKDDQMLHALDRLTFGPRPGDVERLKKIGLKKWIDPTASSGAD